MSKRLTTTQVAKKLKISTQRVAAKLKDNHFPNACLCECGRTMLIPESDIHLVKSKNGRPRIPR